MSFFKKRTLTAKYMALSICASFVILAVAGVLIIMFLFPFATVSAYLLGLFSGCLVSILRLFSMDKSINKSVEMPENKAKNYAMAQYILRFVIVIIYLVIVAFLNKYFDIWGAVLGLLTLQVSSYAGNYLINRHDKREKENMKQE